MSEFTDKYAGSYLLAVGIDQYSDPRFMPLGQAEADAQAVAEVLSGDPYHFDVTLLLGEKATRRAVLNALGKLRQTEPDDRIIFYFAGHGYVLLDNRNNDVGYLACADTEPGDPYGGLEFDEVTKIRRFARAKHISFILDACFSGTALGLTRTAMTEAAVSEYLKHRAYQVLTAGAVEVVSDARSMTGELVNVLREGLPGQSGLLTFSHIGQHVHDVIHNQSKGLQSPICQYLEGSGKGQMVLFAPRAIDMLPADLRAALMDENPTLRRYAIAEAEKLLSDPTCGEAVWDVLGEMQYDDPDRDVRRQAGKALAAAPSPPRKSFEAGDPVGDRYQILDALAAPEPESVVEIPSEPELPLEEEILNIRDILPTPFEWCQIPAGRVTLEDAGTFDVPPFYIAKYPITYAQFQVSLDAKDGFHNDRWWHGLARREAVPETQQWKIDNHPRENVSWYDAIVFCRWLSSKVGYEIRLPTEWEWQWAAQGADGRVYPWGSDFDSKRCNTAESELKKTTPVDRYPAGASLYGALDMAGNVWEWCLNEHEHPENTDLGGDASRVLRGGSWNATYKYARCACRSKYYPYYRLNYYGFRIVGLLPS